jgi:menaquinone-dependent protoporphyrinogen oxidase
MLLRTGRFGCLAAARWATETKDAQGRDKRAVTEPREIAEFRGTITPRDHRVFFGVLDPKKLGFTHRLMLKLPVNRDNAIFPVGDFRDWNDVEAWASSIAQALKASTDDSQCHADLLGSVTAR